MNYTHTHIADGRNWRLGYDTSEIRDDDPLPRSMMLLVEDNAIQSVTATACRHTCTTAVSCHIDTDALIGIAEAVVAWKREQEGAKDAADV